MRREVGPISIKAYRRLISLYPRSFRDRFSVSMEQTFCDLRSENAGSAHLFKIFASTFGGIISERVSQAKENCKANLSLSHPRVAALLGVVLPLPLGLLMLIAVYNIEPFNGFLKPLFTTETMKMKITGLIVFLASLTLLPVAFIFNLAALRRTVRVGGSLFSAPLNLFLAVGLLTAILTLLATFVVDQYPCWVGVPNCD